MSSEYTCDEDLLRRLPLPLAQLYRRAHNAKTSLERHLTAYYLWEVALKLLASVAVVEYAALGDHDAELAERLTNLARPSLGHWWEFVRRLVPVLADRGDAAFQKVREVMLGRSRDDLPRAAGLDAFLRDVLEGRSSARATVRIGDLFDRLVQYRNRELGHGAAGRRGGEFYERMARALLAGSNEVFTHLDVLAGRKLVSIADVRRQVSGHWLIERYELTGDMARRIESLEVPESETAWLPRPERVYLDEPVRESERFLLRSLHPLVTYDTEAGETLFLNARRGQQRTEYLCYTTGRVVSRSDWGGEHRDFLARTLNTPVTDRQAEEWAVRSQAQEQSAEPVPEEPAGPSAPPPRQIGEFELLSTLGRGGMGVVYRAWQPSLGRQVALKCLLRSGDPKAEARFAREIRALGRVEHPHVVKIFTSGAKGDQWFYAMELVEGATLAAVCDKLTTPSPSPGGLNLHTWQETLGTVWEESRRAEKPLSDPASESSAPRAPTAESQALPARTYPVVERSYVRHIVALLTQMAEAAHALHEASVIHRDIKPGNILVSADGSQAVLMDLGLAQLVDDVQGRLTRTRQFVGTLRYASPEQVLAVGGLDRRSDVYSLGATLWELLTLRPMYGADEQTPTPELMRRIEYTEPERLRRYQPSNPADLEAIVLKCLEKDANRRYATAAELAQELLRFLAGEPVLARPVGQMERFWRWCRRRPAAASLLAIVLGCLLVITGMGLWSYRLVRQRLRDSLYQQARAHWLAHEPGWREAALTAIRQAGEIRPGSDLRDLAVQALVSWELRVRRELPLSVGASARAVVFDPQGSELAVAVGPGVQLWDFAAGTSRGTLSEAGQGSVSCLQYSPDGHLLACAADDGMVRLWNRRTGSVVRLAKHDGPVQAVVFGPGVNTVSSTDGQILFVWDLTSGKILCREQLCMTEPEPAAPKPAASPKPQVRPDGLEEKRSAHQAAGREGERMDQALAAVKPPEVSVKQASLVASVRESFLVATTAGEPPVLWKLAAGKLVARELLDLPSGRDAQLALSPDDRHVLWAGNDPLLPIAAPKEMPKPERIEPPKKATEGSGVRHRTQDRLAGWNRPPLLQRWPRTDFLVGTIGLLHSWVPPEPAGQPPPVEPRAVQPPPVEPQPVQPPPVEGAASPLGTVGAPSADILQALEAGHRAAAREPSANIFSGILSSPLGPRRTASIWVYDLTENKGRCVSSADLGNVRAITVSHDGYVLVAGDSGVVGFYRWLPPELEIVSAWNAEPEDLNAIALAPDSHSLVTASAKRPLKVWQREGTEFSECVRFASEKGWYRFGFHPTQPLLAVARMDEDVKLKGLKPVRNLRVIEHNQILSLVWSGSGDRLFFLGKRGLYSTTWPTANAGKENVQPVLAAKEVSRFQVRTLAVSPDGRWLALGGQNPPLVIRRNTDPSYPYNCSLGPEEGMVNVLTFSNQGEILASATSDGAISLWRTKDWSLLPSFPRKATEVLAFAFSPDDRLLAVSEKDGKVTLWDVNQHTDIALPKSAHWVWTLAFSPEGRYLVTGAMDGTVSLWDVARKEWLAKWKGHRDVVMKVLFLGNQDTIISCSLDGEILTWRLDRIQSSLRERGLGW